MHAVVLWGWEKQMNTHKCFELQQYVLAWTVAPPANSGLHLGAGSMPQCDSRLVESDSSPPALPVIVGTCMH